MTLTAAHLDIDGAQPPQKIAHKNLAEALAAAQGELENPIKDRDVQAGARSYSYAALDQVLDLVRPAFSRHGLAFVQMPGCLRDGGEWVATVTNRLMHEAGETLEFVAACPLPSPTPQALGSAHTYLKRYSALGVAAIAAADDDDAGAAQTHVNTARERAEDKERKTIGQKTNAARTAFRVEVSEAITDGRISRSEVADEGGRKALLTKLLGTEIPNVDDLSWDDWGAATKALKALPKPEGVKP